MNNKQVAHLWANQSKDYAKGSNFYFENDTIYSYGSHFPIARIYTENIIFFTTKSYSSSTAKHISIVNGAIDETKYQIINIPFFVHFDHIATKEYFKLKIKNLHFDFKNNRKRKGYILEEILKQEKQFKTYCRLFKIKYEKHKFNFEKYDNEVIQQNLKNLAKAEEKEKLSQIKNLIINQKRLNKFLNEDENIKTVDFRYNTNYLKVKTGELLNGKQICITNNGAEVLKDYVVRALQAFQGNYLTTVTKIGDFTINSIDEKGVKIGCHFFDNEEIERIIKLFA